jgi:hypothetical protein
MNSIFKIKSSEEFLEHALNTYEYQIQHCKVYKEYVERLNWVYPTTLNEIPFLPISFFKTHKVISNLTTKIRFKSSGTGGNRSSHYLGDLSLYNSSFQTCYSQQIGDVRQQIIIALLPNYLEQGDSSLVYMVDALIKKSSSEISGFILNDIEKFKIKYCEAVSTGKEIIIFGVSYALLDLADAGLNLSKATIIETGGMKGKRKELTKEQLHQTLKESLKPKKILSEYGMTELLSQAYCDSDLIFTPPNWMHFLIRDINDPFSYLPENKTGGLNIIDLANRESCSFIATQDLAKANQKGIEIMGRFDNSDIRGCNLLIQ